MAAIHFQKQGRWSFLNKKLNYKGGSMKTAKLFFFLFCFFVVSTMSYAQITSAQNGNWSDASTWVGGVVPGASDNVVIADGHTVTIDIPNATCNDLTVAGYIYFSNTTSGMGLVVNGDAVIENGGRLRMASSTPGIPILYHSVELKKNLTVNSGGTFDMRQTSGANGAVGRVVFSGSENSVINLSQTTYSSNAEEFNSVIIEKTGDAKVILQSGNLFQNNNASNAADTLLFVSGIIETGENMWVHLATSSAAVQGASSASYINGILGRGISNSANNSVTRELPIGDGTTFRPVEIKVTAPANATGHFVWARVVNEDANTGSSTFSPGIDKVSQNRYYEIGYIQGAGTAAEMPVYKFAPAYNSDDGVSAGNMDLRVAYSTDSRASWQNAGPFDHTTDLSNLPALIESDSLDSPVSLATGTSVFVALARAAGTTTNDVPVELTSFSASILKDKIELQWITATEKNNSGFEVEKSVDGKSFSKIAFVPGAGTTTESKSYSFTDADVSPQKYYYRLKQIDFDGTVNYSNIVEVDFAAELNFSMEQNYPNPFNPSTTISFSTAKEVQVKLSIINALGETVKLLLNELKPAGYHQVTFDASGFESGVYFYKIEAGDFVKTSKMLLLK